MKLLTETFVKACDLLEAEGRLLRQQITHMGFLFLLMFGATVMALAGLGLLLAALYQALELWFGYPSLALLITAMVCLLIAGGIAWAALRLNRSV